MDQDTRQPWTLSKTAEELGVTVRVVRNALRRGELQGFKIGRYFRILPESVDRKRAGAGAPKVGEVA